MPPNSLGLDYSVELSVLQPPAGRKKRSISPVWGLLASAHRAELQMGLQPLRMVAVGVGMRVAVDVAVRVRVAVGVDVRVGSGVSVGIRVLVGGGMVGTVVGVRVGSGVRVMVGVGVGMRRARGR